MAAAAAVDLPELLSSIEKAQRHINDRSTVYVVYGKSTTVIGSHYIYGERLRISTQRFYGNTDDICASRSTELNSGENPNQNQTEKEEE